MNLLKREPFRSISKNVKEKFIDNFGKLIEEAGKRQVKKDEEIDLGEVPVEIEFQISNDVVEAILDKAHSSKSDLIIVGSRGRSATAALLLGSFTKQLIQKSRLPLLAVKDKEENMGLIEAILHL